MSRTKWQTQTHVTKIGDRATRISNKAIDKKKIILDLWIWHVAIDEAHCVVSWGQSNFRLAFLALQSLKCFALTSQIMALNPTASPAAQAEIAKELLTKNAQTVSLTSGRYMQNVNYIVKYTVFMI